MPHSWSRETTYPVHGEAAEVNLTNRFPVCFVFHPRCLPLSAREAPRDLPFNCWLSPTWACETLPLEPFNERPGTAHRYLKNSRGPSDLGECFGQGCVFHRLPFPRAPNLIPIFTQPNFSSVPSDDLASSMCHFLSLFIHDWHPFLSLELLERFASRHQKNYKGIHGGCDSSDVIHNLSFIMQDVPPHFSLFLRWLCLSENYRSVYPCFRSCHFIELIVSPFKGTSRGWFDSRISLGFLYYWFLLW